MTRGTLVNVLILLAALGLIDSLYLASHALESSALFCDIGAGLDGCNQVAQSPYSRPFGIPLAYLGVVFYALLLIASLVAVGKWSAWVHRALLAISVIGALFSVVFLYIQFALIQALCIYCIASAAIAFLSVAVSFWLDHRHKPEQAPVLP